MFYYQGNPQISYSKFFFLASVKYSRSYAVSSLKDFAIIYTSCFYFSNK